jgi:hypothetical protein
LAIVEDSRLIELAADRPEELFLTLHRAAAFRPLLVVLCTLPGLYALAHGVCDDVDSLWGLRSLPVLTSEDLEQVVDPPAKGPEEVLRWQPLLGNWLMAFSMHWAGSMNDIGVGAVPYLSTVLLLAMCYLLVDRVSGPRVALWTMMLAAFQGPIVAQVTEYAPFTLAIALAMCSFWGFLGHLQRGDQAVSFDLLLGGVFLGLCTLAGGPLALTVVLILLLHVLGLRGEKSTAKRGRMVQQRRVWIGWPALKSLSVLCLTAFAVGGWWVLMMRYSYGREFWNGWLAGGLHGESPFPINDQTLAEGSFGERLARQFVGMTGIISGAAILGVCCAVRELFVEEDDSGAASISLVAWCALVMFLASIRSSEGASISGPMWQMFLLVPSVCCAGLALDQISLRRVRVETVGATTLATMFLGYVWSQPLSAPILPTFGSAASWLAAGLTLVWGLHRLCTGREARQRVVLSTLIIALVISNAASGARSVRLADRTITCCQHKRLWRQRPTCVVLITDGDPPLRIQFALRSLWPAAEFHVLRTTKEAPAPSIWNESDFPGTAGPLVVEWSDRDSRAETPVSDQYRMTPLGDPQFFKGRTLRAHRLEWIASE